MPRRKQQKDVDVYQLKVTLAYSKPPIWRRVRVRGDTKLQKLHRIIQVAMGWEDLHLHKFTIGEKHYGEPYDLFPGTINEKNIKLSEVIPEEKTKFSYVYDFGDSWNHNILVEKIIPPDPDVHYPVCLKGKRACPPEDCGGIFGYHGLLDVLANPDDPEYKDWIEWIDEDFDPDAFDLDDVNLRLRDIK